MKFALLFGVDVNCLRRHQTTWPLTFKASSVYKIELRPLISGYYFALLEVRNLCMASRQKKNDHCVFTRDSRREVMIFSEKNKVLGVEANRVMNILVEIKKKTYTT